MNVQKIIEYRRIEDEKLFYIIKQTVRRTGNYTIVRRGKLLGLVNADNKEILPTIFDDIKGPYQNHCLFLCVENKWGFYNLHENRWLLSPLFDELYYHDQYNTLEIITKQKHGLYSIRLDKIIIQPQYDEVCLIDINDYIWARQEKKIIFFKTETGISISPSDVEMVYDIPHHMVVKHYNGRICCINEDGIDDRLAYRRFIIKHRGRYKFQNYKYQVNDLADIYGYVLNEELW